jgi:hypothetical protein
VTDQERIDYINEAQMRVAVDANLIEKEATLTFDTNGQAVIPGDVVVIRGLSQGATDYPVYNDTDYYRAQTAGTSLVTPGYTIADGKISIVPTPSTEYDLTITYQARPSEHASNKELEVGVRAERAVELRVLADRLSDERQDELADYYDGLYQQEVSRLRREPKRQQPSRLSSIEHDR